MNSEFHYRVHKNPSFLCILSQISPLSPKWGTWNWVDLLTAAQRLVAVTLSGVTSDSCTTFGGCDTEWRYSWQLHKVWWLWHWVALQLTAAQRLVAVTLSGVTADSCTTFGGCDTEWRYSWQLHNVLWLWHRR